MTLAEKTEVIRLGLVADPDTPRQIAERLAESLPEELSGEREWQIDVETDPVTAGLRETWEILDLTEQKRREHGWHYAICITDLPVRTSSGPLVAEVDHDQGTAVVSVPALGGFQPRRRVGQVIRQVLDDLRGEHGERPGEETEELRHGLSSSLTRVVAPIRRRAVTEPRGAVDVQYVSTRTRGRVRLLTGMVRTNRPWRLIFGLSRALAAAVATSAFGLSSTTIWMIGDQLGTTNKIMVMVAAVAALVFWLIAAHDLWETRRSAVDRELAWLYNASTLLTLTIGVVVLYAILFVVNVVLATLIVPSSLLSSTVGRTAGLGTYLSVAWAFTTLGAIAGALGSSLETDHAVRQAAYGYRESTRRAEHQREQEQREHGEDL
ncbi:hypothetical protein ACFSVJ_09705 [Prauserella oleivorans]